MYKGVLEYSVKHPTLVEPDGQLKTGYPLSADQTIVAIVKTKLQ